MYTCKVWEGLDRLAFYEHAIILEAKYRSQGKLKKNRIISTSVKLPSQIELPNHLLRNFLDDIALIVAASGGKDNVSAVCIETAKITKTYTLRIARNNGISSETVGSIKDIIDLMMGATAAGTFL